MNFQILLTLLAIILLASFFRFYKLKERGLLAWDDAVRVQELLFLEDLISFVFKNFRDILDRKSSLKENALHFRGRHLFDSNPLNIFSYWLASKFTRDIEDSGLLANAFLGVGSVLGTFFLADLLFGKMVGMAADTGCEPVHGCVHKTIRRKFASIGNYVLNRNLICRSHL